MASTFLQRNFTNAPTSQTIMTYSFWVKKSALATGNSNKGIFGHIEIGNAGNSNLQVGWTGDNDFQIGYYSNNGSDTHIDYVTNARFRDNNGWYHVCIEINTTLTTADDRVKLYINGVLVTSYSTKSNPPKDRTINTGNMYMYIGQYAQTGGTQVFFDGLLSEFIHSDGYAYSASTFGETDTDTGEWRIKDNPTFTPGNQGFKILSNGSTITDQSAGSNNFTATGGTLTDTKDCPSNVFATWNPLAQPKSGISYEAGNTTVATSADVGQRQSISTLAASSGKFYMECKLQAIGSNVGGSYPYAGASPQSNFVADTYVGRDSIGYGTTGYVYLNNNSGTNTGTTYTSGDIISVALDVTNSKIYFAKNGTYISNGTGIGNPTTGANPFDISSLTSIDAMGFATSLYNNNGVWQCNFGNGFFGTTAVADNSTATASTPGVFNYDVPTGYQPLSTKGLNA
tara:strand:- start:404 stop:1771 length:1368 start_codon:yes stop_codon:yes gene_type:complete